MCSRCSQRTQEADEERLQAKQKEEAAKEEAAKSAESRQCAKECSQARSALARTKELRDDHDEEETPATVVVYNKGEIIDVTGAGSEFYKREVTINGVRIVAAGNVGGQQAVPDAFLEKVARMVELFTDPNGEGIDAASQINFIKTLNGAPGTYHAGIPTLQRVARGGGDDEPARPRVGH